MLPLLARLGSWFPPPFQPAFIVTLAQQLNGASAMPRPTDKIARLRGKHHSLEDLPDAIDAPWRGAGETVPLDAATVDDVAFAIVAANARVSTAIGKLAKLESLHRIAREAGGIGADLAVDAALGKEAR